MVGQTVGPYRILAKHGEGGMGVVYRALDTRLNRVVALKALPVRLGTDELLKARLQREARAASAVDHPNICSIYGFEETADGRQFIVMPLYEGESLKQKLASGHRPTIDESLNITLQAAQGLAAAHARGVIHRDIKPGNLLITKEGQVKIVDFGLATLSDTSKLTFDGDLLGTPAYMSPEQTRGQEADHRSDIWSLAVVMYEMVSGRLPFRGDHIEALIYAIRNDPPLPLTDVAGLPAPIATTLRHALVKDPAVRYQSMATFASDLAGTGPGVGAGPAAHDVPSQRPADWTRRFAMAAAAAALALIVWAGWTWTRRGETVTPLRSGASTTATAANVQSIAVFPFRNRGSDTQYNYVGPGLADVLAARLTNAALFEVRSPASKGQSLSDAEQLALARDLGVDALLTGTYQVEQNVLSMSYLLQDTRNAVNLAGDVIDVTFDRTIDAEKRLARAVILALRPSIPEAQQLQLTTGETQHNQAFQAFLRSQSQLELFWEQPGSSQLDAARQSLEQAVRFDANYTRAAVQLIVVDWLGAFWGYRPSPDGLARAEKMADSTIERDPTFADAYAARALLRFQKGALDEARSDLRTALGRSPRSALAYYAAGWYFLARGFNDHSVTAFQRASQIQPELVRRELGIAYRYQGNLVRAEQRYREDLKLYPGDVQTESNLAASLLAQGRRGPARVPVDRHVVEATEIGERLVAANPRDPAAQWVATLIRAYRGDKSGIAEWVEQYRDAYWNDAGYSVNVAAVWAEAGDVGRTVTWLKRAEELGFHNYPFLQVYRFFDPIRLDQRFVVFLNDLKAEWDASWDLEQRDPLMPN